MSESEIRGYRHILTQSEVDASRLTMGKDSADRARKFLSGLIDGREPFSIYWEKEGEETLLCIKRRFQVGRKVRLNFGKGSFDHLGEGAVLELFTRTDGNLGLRTIRHSGHALNAELSELFSHLHGDSMSDREPLETARELLQSAIKDCTGGPPDRARPYMEWLAGVADGREHVPNRFTVGDSKEQNHGFYDLLCGIFCLTEAACLQTKAGSPTAAGDEDLLGGVDLVLAELHTGKTGD